MDKYEYKAKDNNGETRKGVVEAKDEKLAVKILRERGFFVISLKPKSKGFLAETKSGFLSRVSLSDRVNFTRQLSTMIMSGLPVTEALEILELQTSPAMAKVISEILRDVEGGGNLASSLEKHPEVFDQVYIALIRSGEAAGVLDKVLNRLADNLEKEKEFNSKVKGAMIYPIIVVSGMILVAAIMIIFVIPKMTKIYEEFQADLPAPTKILMAVSSFATNFWWLCLILIAGVIFGIRILSKNPQFKKRYDEMVFTLPIIGNLRKQIMLTEFTRTLGLLISAGILIVDAIEIVRHSLKSPVFEKAVTEAGKEVEKGLPLATALARAEVFPPILPQMIAVGEETGKLDEVLTKVSSYFDQEAETAVKGLTSALEPLIMVVLGLGVAFLMIAVIMPIYNLTNQF